MGTHPIFESDFDCLTVRMSFDLSSASGLESFNKFLLDNSYAAGWVPSQADVALFKALAAAPDAKFENVLRWWNNLNSYSSEFASLPTGSASAAPAEEEDDDDVDLFGDDDEDDEEAERIKQERVAAYAARKEKKPALIAKSNIILDVKPWDDETDMKEVEAQVRKIEADGLLWGAAKLVPLAYGIKKLQISTVVEDDKISVDWLVETIQEIEDLVQSVDIAAFNKI